MIISKLLPNAVVFTALSHLPVSLSAIPAFAGAEGFGSDTHHARGTPVCVVDNLRDIDESQQNQTLIKGSFRYCLARAESIGGGYIIFDVSGSIKLERPIFVPSNTYIAGQTSHGGIALQGQPVILEDVHDIVIRHVRHREANNLGDAFTIKSSTNIVFDHISVSFFKDGAVDIVNHSHDITVQWSHMGDAIDSGSENERYHGQPNLLRDGVNRISLHHNFYTHGHSRMPLANHTVAERGFLIDFSNNLIYNYGKFPSRFAAIAGRGNVRGNYYIPGRNTYADGTDEAAVENKRKLLLHEQLKLGAQPPILVENGMQIHLNGNLMDDGVGHDASIFTDKYGKQIELGIPGPVTSVRNAESLDEARMVASRSGKIIQEALPFRALRDPIEDIPLITIYPAVENKDIVIRNFGALPRDNTDKRLVRELVSRTGRWKYRKPADNNQYIHQKLIDSDADGLPDDFENRHGGSIQPLGHDLDERLDNIEIYLDKLASALLK